LYKNVIIPINIGKDYPNGYRDNQFIPMCLRVLKYGFRSRTKAGWVQSTYSNAPSAIEIWV